MNLKPDPPVDNREILFYLFDKALADVAEGSDIIGKNFYGNRFSVVHKFFITPSKGSHIPHFTTYASRITVTSPRRKRPATLFYASLQEQSATIGQRAATSFR